VPDRLEELKDNTNLRTGWRYTTADNSIETYTLSGKLTSIADSSGLTQTLAYSDASTPATIAPATRTITTAWHPAPAGANHQRQQANLLHL
jgi:uncharacterized protein RhaS with RHS repeats